MTSRRIANLFVYATGVAILVLVCGLIGGLITAFQPIWRAMGQ